ncbi:MAG: nonstructural protein [Microvirus sp.]|nr:MAG: nonstructural protein [Microvirus sp.]
MFKKGSTDTNPDLEVFTIYDSKSESYDVPAFAQNKNVLMRDIINMFNDPQQTKNRFLVNAEDYSIFKIGSYDKSTGLIKSHNLEHVANMHDLRAMSQPAMVRPERPAQEIGIVPT